MGPRTVKFAGELAGIWLDLIARGRVPLLSVNKLEKLLETNA